MAAGSRASLATLLAVLTAASVSAGAPGPALGQVPKGVLQRLGGPASLLRQALSSMPDLRELADPERRQWEPAFRGEAVRLGPSRNWLDASWSLRLSAVDDTVYRVTVETFHSDMADADRLRMTDLAEGRRTTVIFTSSIIHTFTQR